MDILTTIGTMIGSYLLVSANKNEKENASSLVHSAEFSDDSESGSTGSVSSADKSIPLVVSDQTMMNSSGKKFMYSGLEPAPIYLQVSHNVGKNKIATIGPKTYLGILTDISYHDWIKVRTVLNWNRQDKEYFFWVNKRNIRAFKSLEEGAKYGKSKLLSEIRSIMRYG